MAVAPHSALLACPPCTAPLSVPVPVTRQTSPDFRLPDSWLGVAGCERACSPNNFYPRKLIGRSWRLDKSDVVIFGGGRRQAMPKQGLDLAARQSYDISPGPFSRPSDLAGPPTPPAASLPLRIIPLWASRRMVPPARHPQPAPPSTLPPPSPQALPSVGCRWVGGPVARPVAAPNSTSSDRPPPPSRLSRRVMSTGNELDAPADRATRFGPSARLARVSNGGWGRGMDGRTDGRTG